MRTARRGEAGVARAEKLYARVFNEYGDDSVAQLGGAHLACEYVSNVLTKVLEWGRLMAYFEQSTRYVPYTDQAPRPLAIPRPRGDRPGRSARALRTDDEPRVRALREVDSGNAAAFRAAVSQTPGRLGRVHRAAIRAKALDTLRGCCLRRRSPTSAFMAPARRSRPCCSGCGRIRSTKSGPAPRRC